MPILDRVRRGRVCRTLLANVDLPELWTRRGPTREAKSLLKDSKADMDLRQRVILRLTWGIWGSEVSHPASELFSLDGDALYLVGSLLVALSDGPRSIDMWIQDLAPKDFRA
jgi:hypothetical protein